jgi:sugar lactone lactonase YvrE
MRIVKRAFIIILLMLSVSVMQACFKEIVETREPVPDILWPKPPEIPRIRLVNSITAPRDVNIAETRGIRFLRFLKGEKARPIVNPYGLTRDREGRLYVVDTFYKIIHVMDERDSVYYSFPEKGTRFTSPIDIAIDNKGIIYVTDSKEAVVKVFRDNGKKYVGELGRGIMNRPTGITFNRITEEILVADTKNSEIIRYNTHNRTVKGIIGKEGSAEGLFYNPTNINTDQNGRIIVSDSLNFRVQVFSPEGKFITAFGSAGDSPGYFARPKGIAADSDGNIYVVDALFDTVQIFNSEGQLLMDFGQPGGSYGEFWLPSGIYIDRDDRIYVSDSYNHRVQVFQYMKESPFID